MHKSSDKRPSKPITKRAMVRYICCAGRAILRESQRYIASGVSPVELQRGIDLASKEIILNLNDAATPVTSINDIEQIATISANNDKTIGKLIATAIDKVGQDGSITIEESFTETTLDITEGFKFNSASVLVRSSRSAPCL